MNARTLFSDVLTLEQGVELLQVFTGAEGASLTGDDEHA